MRRSPQYPGTVFPRWRSPVRVLCLFVAAIACSGGLTESVLDARAQEPQNLSAIYRAVDQHLRREVLGLPGTASFTVGSLDSRLALPACPVLETFPAPGARPWGNSSVGVRCNGPSRWSIYVPVSISLTAEFVTTARALAQGELLTVQDLAIQRGDLAHLPAGIVTNPGAAIGKKIAVSIAAGQPLRHDMLRAPVVIQQGQAVRVVAHGRGFQVTANGRAVTNAYDGQVVQIRMQSGQVISGIARPGPFVEVTPGG